MESNTASVAGDELLCDGLGVDEEEEDKAVAEVNVFSLHFSRFFIVYLHSF